MKAFIIAIITVLICMAANAKPHCQSFNNYNDKVTIVFTDDNAGEKYFVSDVKLIPCYGKEYPATSVKVESKDGVATVTLTFPHLTHFSNPKVALRINGKKTTFKVCQ